MKRASTQKFLIQALFILAFSCLTYGQDNPSPPTQTTADENFTLNITEERTTETNYERSKAVEVKDNNKETGLFVRVGATVFAKRIDITLRGITGNGRFRASLETIQRLLERNAKPPSEP
jgi:hypothetical protein